MSRKNLRELYAEHTGKESDKWSLYLREYDRLFADFRDKRIRLFEIGIQNGGSLEIWSKFFESASIICGCDVNPDCARLSYDDPRISVIIGDANATEVRERVLYCSPEFDIIIDDGSHLSSDIIKTFGLYFPALKEGGIFVAEDLHCSYWQQFEGGLFDPFSSITFFKRLADVINHEHWGVPKARAEILSGIFNKYGCVIDLNTLGEVHSVEFINSMCVVRKAPVAENSLGVRTIAGSVELVVKGNANSHGSPYRLDPICEQSQNPWSIINVPQDEGHQSFALMLADAKKQNAGLGTELADAKQKLADSKQQNAELAKEIASLRSSVSWRLTRSLRYLVELAKGHLRGSQIPAARISKKKGAVSL